MQFTRIRLQGFKSFVDPTDLMIMEGLTGVVGPNGCGKSNLLEALRWVMGENRPTQMRGGGMEDVIFAGTSSRGAKHFAEVTLHIDNSSRLAPATFNHEKELDVIRRITRDIGSAFKVNGKDVRARDVSMMFADAATGSQSPSLVRQGQISELINAKPQARRRVLEDAAGISGLYQRRHEAELKLNSAETNLLRVDDVLENLASQIRSLERQARTATKYKTIAADLRSAEAVLAFIEWQLAANNFIDVEREVTFARTERAKGERERIATESAMNNAQGALPALRDEEAIAAALLQRLTIALGALGEDETRAKREIDALIKAGESLERDQSRETQIAHDASEAKERLEWERTQIVSASEGEEDVIIAATEKASRAHDELVSSEATFDELRQNLAREEARAAAALRRHSEAESRQEKTARAVEASRIEAEETAGKQSQATKALHRRANELQTAEAAIATLETEFSAADHHRIRLQEKFDKTRSILAERTGALSALEAEHRGLLAILNKSAATSPIIDELSVEPGFEAAVGSALDEDLNAPISETASGWRTTLPVDGSTWPLEIIPLSNHVTAPAVLARRMAYIGIVDAITSNIISGLLPGQRIVTKLGDMARWDGFVRLASDGDSAAALRLQQHNRLRELEATIAEAQREHVKLEANIQEVQTGLAVARQKLDEANSARRDGERALTEAIRQHNTAENELERLSSRVDILSATRTRHSEELNEAEKELTEAAEKLVDTATLDELKSELEAFRTHVENERSQMLTLRSAVDELRRERTRRQSRLEDIKREAAGWQKRLDNAATHQSELKRRIDENQSAQKSARALPGELQQKRHLLEADISNAEKRMNTAKEALAAGESTRARTEAAHREAERKLADIREKLAGLEASLEGARNIRDEAAENIRKAYDQTPETMGGALQSVERTLPDIEESRREISRLISAREALGAVNLRAEEDRAEVTDEFNKLTFDKAEITEAIAKLRQAIAALNKEGRERLLVAFDEVNANFKMLFVKLFGGGDADLKLIESDDPLNAGLEIFCQPPGKKLATLSLLSGGEQTLTALSLIFAVFLTNPSPICVLDEVDAPLDDANVTRFCDMLDEMTRQTDTRFLIITHHAVTMARMDRLFGVTMAEKGVSQLVSVDLEAAEKLVEDV